MTQALHTEDQALRFYRAALATAQRVDEGSETRTLDADADAAWRAYGADLPVAVRCDLVLRNLAILYPAAFAPGPVFGLPGWHEDDPWGTRFERPAPGVMAGIFVSRMVPASSVDALEQALGAWGLGVIGAAPVAASQLAGRLSPAVNMVVTGARAAAEVARAFVSGERLSVRAQVVLVSDRPEARHALGIACALLREQRVPSFASPAREVDESWAAWADREKRRLGSTQARLLVTSSDAGADELEAARAFAAALGASDVIEIAEA
jgi:hypothetical protein